MRTLLYICGSGHSGSTLLDRLLGRYRDVAALGEIHRFSLGLHRSEGPFRCDCGAALPDCAFWTAVIADLERHTGRTREDLLARFETTSHAALAQSSGERYFNAQKRYRLVPNDLTKGALAFVPRPLAGVASKLGLLGDHLVHARNSLQLFDAVSRVSGAPVIVDSTKNPVRMRSLYLAGARDMRIVYLTRDGRAVANSRMKRQGVDMAHAARVWKAENRRLELMLRHMPGVPVHHVAYEDLCRDPEGEMARLLAFGGIDPARAASDAVRHAVGGNPSRYGALDIRVDDAWRRELDATQLAAFDRVVGQYDAGKR